MDSPEKTELELLKEDAKKLGIKLPTGPTDIDKIRAVVDEARLEFQIRKEETIRAKLRAEAEIKRRLADVEAEASLASVKITIPADPTLTDVVRLEKKLKMQVKEPKPSIETLAIEASKKVYATFKNMEPNSDEVDIVSMPGGKYRFHCWPERKHVIPEWLIKYHAEQCTIPIMKNRPNAAGNMVPTQVGTKERFLWQVHGDAPKDAPFGVCIKEAV